MRSTIDGTVILSEWKSTGRTTSGDGLPAGPRDPTNGPRQIGGLGPKRWTTGIQSEQTITQLNVIICASPMSATLLYRLAAAVGSPEAVSQTDPDPSVSRHSSEIRRLTWHLAAVWCAAQKNVEQIGADSLCHCIQRITGWMQNNLQQPNAIQTFVREFRRCP